MKKTPAPKLTMKYWLPTGIFRDHIRVEWQGPHGVMTSTATLDSRRFGYQTLVWGYDAPPDHIDELALEALLADGEHTPEGTSLEGYESRAQMDAVVCGDALQEAA